MAKKVIIIALLAGMLFWAFYDSFLSEEKNAGVEESEEAEVGIEIGDVAPDFEAKTLDGKLVKLSDFRGQKVMVNFWATWCPPCRAEMPDMQRLFEETDIVILGVNLTTSENSKSQVQNFIEEMDISFQILLDEKNVVANIYAIQPIPTTYIIDKSGVIQYKTMGPMNYNMMKEEYDKLN